MPRNVLSPAWWRPIVVLIALLAMVGAVSVAAPTSVAAPAAVTAPPGSTMNAAATLASSAQPPPGVDAQEVGPLSPALAETPLLGTPSEPTAGLAQAPPAPQAPQAPSLRAPARAGGDIGGYQISARQPVIVRPGYRPYEDLAVSDIKGFGLRDAGGVRVFRFSGSSTIWQHPVAQAQYGLINMNSYRVTGNRAYLVIAERNAQRNIDRRVESGGAWYYPYDFDFAVHGDTTQTLRAPWYSAMAQGQLLGLFVRLYQATGAAKWRTAADATFRSLQQAPSGAAPFASRVDANGRLWFEEYPRYPASNSEQVLNGHIYAMYGLHDYWMLTESPAALHLLRGGLATIEQTVLTGFRRTNWLSVYSLRHKVNSASYHPVHIRQFLELWRLTQDPRWVDNAALFRNDYANMVVNVTATFTARTKLMYKLSPDNRIVQTRTVSFSRHTNAPIDRRMRIPNGPMALRISAGPYLGWWVPEAFGHSWALGALNIHSYRPLAFIRFRGGTTFSAYRLDSRGAVAGSKTLTIPSGRISGAPTRMSGFVQGRPAYYFEVGAFAGYWVPMQSKVYVGQAYPS